MERAVLRVLAHVAALVVLSLPVPSSAQSIAESVSKLSTSDVERILHEQPTPPNQTSQTAKRSGSKSNKAIGVAAIGALAGASVGALINPSCPAEHGSGSCLVLPAGLAVAGAVIGALAVIR